MESNQQPRHQQDEEQQPQQEQNEPQTGTARADTTDEFHKTSQPDKRQKEKASGTSIVRGNTPRPRAYGTMPAIPPSQLQSMSVRNARREPSSTSAFPSKPPSAPPLPEDSEELIEIGEHTEEVATPLPERPSATPETQDFLWLFEYGLEMDTALLNTPERLDGLALLYGPAVLKGYTLVAGKYMEGYTTRVLVTIEHDPRPSAEVWGVLYRVPRHIAEGSGGEPSLLDTIHVSPHNALHAVNVVVREVYRHRELSCLTYVCSNVMRYQPLLAQDDPDLLVRRLSAIAKKQRLPESYIDRHIRKLAEVVAHPGENAQIVYTTEQAVSPIALMGRSARVTQDTEPLPLSVTKGRDDSALTSRRSPLLSPVQRIPPKRYTNGWLMVFAVYLFCLLLTIVTFAVLQGMGVIVLSTDVALLNVPWLVLVYGLLGGCVSSIIRLGRTSQPIDQPGFVTMTWFTRPYIGVVLAIFAYLLLSSGLLISTSTRHEALFLLVGALAGLCEGWFFLRRRNS